MTIKQLMEFLANIPKEDMKLIESFNLVNGEYSPIDDDEENFHYRMDKPIVALYIDDENEELILLHQSEDEINFIMDPDDTE